MDVGLLSGRKLTGSLAGHLALPVAAAIALCVGQAVADTAQYSVAQVQAALLLRFSENIEWPNQAFSEPAASFVICILGDDDFAQVTRQTLAREKANDRPLKIKAVTDSKRLTGCHMLFVGKAATAPIGQLREQLAGAATLTISDVETFAREGGMIEFFLRGGKVGYAINRKTAEQAGLKIRSDLLRFAKLVR